MNTNKSAIIGCLALVVIASFFIGWPKYEFQTVSGTSSLLAMWRLNTFTGEVCQFVLAQENGGKYFDEKLYKRCGE